jgi:hypothetical protein
LLLESVSLSGAKLMPRGRPKGEEETEVIAVRVPKSLLADLDRYINLLESRIGLKANRSSIGKHALEIYLKERLSEPTEKHDKVKPLP